MTGFSSPFAWAIGTASASASWLWLSIWRPFFTRSYIEGASTS